MLLSKDPRDLATAEVRLNLVLLTGSVHEASGSNLILSPLPPAPNWFLSHFPNNCFPHFFCNASPPRCRCRFSLCAADLPEVTGRSGEERSLGAECSCAPASRHLHRRTKYSRWVFFSERVLDYF